MITPQITMDRSMPVVQLALLINRHRQLNGRISMRALMKTLLNVTAVMLLATLAHAQEPIKIRCH